MTADIGSKWSRIFLQAAVAGIVGAVVIQLYLVLTVIVPQQSSIAAFWQWIASVALGKAALTSANYAWLGLLLHLAVSIGWAGGYAFLAAQRAFLNQRWLVSGLVYGLVVYVFMQLLLLGANSFQFPATPNQFINGIAATTVFFGLPVAFVVSRMNVKATR